MLEQASNFFFVMKRICINTFLILFFLLDSSYLLYSQYAPPAGQPGSTAIYADTNIFVAWANSCDIERGFVNISVPSLGKATVGDNESALNKSDNNVVSLGDAGIAYLYFDIPVADGNGWDFAVFENSFSDDFLELAYVEVSSNNTDYYRFNSISLTQHETQIETFGVLDATKIYNLAGKYRGGYGVPFDLSELAGIGGLDVYNITSIKIIDVVGSIDSTYANYDLENRIINDPWPTPFESSGFDLDAVGVINNRDNTGIYNIKSVRGSIFPNPTTNSFNINTKEKCNKIIVSNLSGNVIKEMVNPMGEIDIKFLTPGYYIVSIHFDNKITTDKMIKM